MSKPATSLRASWESEVQAAWLYRVLAGIESGANRKLFEALADDALEQGAAWAREIEKTGQPAPGPYRATFRVRLVGSLLRRLGPRSLLPALAALKVRGLSIYRSGPSSLDILTEPESAMETDSGDRHRLDEERRHFYARGTVALHAAIFGVNDGLVANTALVLAVGGLGGEPLTALLVGGAGMLAGAVSMGAGEYLGTRSRIELFERQIALEEEELRLYPEDEAEELALIFEARGLPREQAVEFGHRLIGNPARALDVLSREELGLNPDELGSPWASGTASFLSFAAGSAIPLLPLLVLSSGPAFLGAALVSAVALFAAGAATSLFTGRKAWKSGLRLATVGAALGAGLFVIARAVSSVVVPGPLS